MTRATRYIASAGQDAETDAPIPESLAAITRDLQAIYRDPRYFRQRDPRLVRRAARLMNARRAAEAAQYTTREHTARETTTREEPHR